MISRLQLQTVKTLIRHNSCLHVVLRPLPIISLNPNTNLNQLYLIQSHSASMADKADKSQYQKPKVTEFKDDDGNIISKSAWKKLQKKKAAEKKRAEKEAKQAKKGKKVNESNLTPNV